MYRDQKVGLALSVLLVGIVGAFFFRNEGPPSDEPPKLSNESEIDAAIADGDSVPYLTGIESDDSSSTEDRIEIAVPELKDVDDPHWEVPDFLRDDHSSLTDQTSESAPNPISIVESPPSTGQRNTAIEIPRSNNAWDSTNKDGVKSGTTKQDAEFVLHQVAKGDNLSNLAKWYLGDSARFGEIYQANTDLLKTADDLQVGMKLRIPKRFMPSKTGIAGKESSADTNRTAKPDAKENTGAKGKVPSTKVSHQPKQGVNTNSKKRLFSPIGRSPLTPSSSKNAKDQSSDKKSLRQTAPPEYKSPDPADDVSKDETSSAKKSDQSRPRRYTVRRGDSLARIAIRFYGTNKAAQKIFAANRNVLKDPNAIREGVTLELP